MSEQTTSHDYGESPVAPPRQVLTYIAGAAALLFAVVGVILAVLYVGASRQAEEARLEASRTAEEAFRNAEAAAHHDQETREQLAQAVSARELAETQAAAGEQARLKAKEQADETRQKIAQAEKNARAADSLRAEALEKERKSRAESQVADEQRKQEAERRRDSLEQIIKLDVLHATTLLDEHDLPQALLWYTEALRAANKDRFPEDAHRMRLAIALGQHPRPVQSLFLEAAPTVVQLSPDGKRIVTAGADGAARLWDTTTGKQVGEALNQGAPVTAATFSPDAKRLLTVAADGHVHLWDVGTGKPAFAPLAHDAPVALAQFTPDGKGLLTLSADRTGKVSLHLWDAAKGEAVGKPFEQVGLPKAVGFNADGREVLLAGADGSLRRWNPATGNTTGVVVDQAGAVEHAAFSDDGQRLVTSSERTARVWQVQTGKPLSPPLKHPDALAGVEFSTGGGRVLTLARDRAVRVWDAATGQLVGSPLKHADAVSLATFSADGRHVLTTSADGLVRLWNTASGDELQRFWQSGAVQHAEFGPAGASVLTLEGKVVRLWDLTVAEPPAPVPAEVAGRTWFSPDGKIVLRANGSTAQLSTVDKNQPIGAAIKHQHPVTAAIFSGDSKRVATLCNEQAGTDLEWLIQVWDTATGKEVGPAVLHLHPVTALAINRDGKTVLTATSVNQTEVRLGFYDTATAQAILKKPILFSQPIARALFTPDGKFAVTAMGNIVNMWDPNTGEQAGKRTVHTFRSAVTQFVFSPDGKRILTADSAGAVFIAEVGTMEEVAKLPDHPGAVTFAAFSADGKRVATCCADRNVRIWEVDKAKPVGTPMAHSAVPLAAFSPDGRWLATAAGNHLRLWDATTGEPASPALLHAPEPAPITYLTVRADGKVVTGTGQADDPRGRRTWDLLPDARPIAEIEEMVHLLTGHRLENLAVASVSADAAKKAWDDLKPRFPADFAASPARELAWVRRALAECERDQNWAGVISHIDRLIAAEPGRVDLYLQRAAAHRALHQLDRLLADYSAAIAQAKDRVDLVSLRAAAYVEQRQWQQAVADYSRVIELTPDDLNAWSARGRAEAELGQWAKASADFGRVNARGGEEAGTFRDQALACLGAGDLAGYKQVCARMSKRLASSQHAAPTIAWTCSLAPDALPDLKGVLQHATRAQAANPKSVLHLIALGALLYRTGQLQPALQQLDAAQGMSSPADAPVTWLLLAMTQQRLGRADQAKKWLDKAGQEATAVRDGRTWQRRLEISLLTKEARTLVKGK